MIGRYIHRGILRLADLSNRCYRIAYVVQAVLPMWRTAIRSTVSAFRWAWSA